MQVSAFGLRPAGGSRLIPCYALPSAPPRSASPSTALEVAAITIGAIIGLAVIWYGTRRRPVTPL
jgi:hypothetical protein